MTFFNTLTIQPLRCADRVAHSPVVALVVGAQRVFFVCGELSDYRRGFIAGVSGRLARAEDGG